MHSGNGSFYQTFEGTVLPDTSLVAVVVIGIMLVAGMVWKRLILKTWFYSSKQ